MHIKGPVIGATSRGLWMPELVLYGIRLLAKQFLGTVLDIEVDQSDFNRQGSPTPTRPPSSKHAKFPFVVLFFVG